MVDKTNKKGGTTAKTPLINPNLRGEEWDTESDATGSKEEERVRVFIAAFKKKYEEERGRGKMHEVALNGAATYARAIAAHQDPETAQGYAEVAMAFAKPINRMPSIIIM